MSVVQEVLSWWGGQLRDLLPARLLRTELHGDALIAELQADGTGLAWFQRRGRSETALGDPGQTGALLRERKSRRVLLRVPSGIVLERSLTLPLATESELDRVITYEVDRISPFAVPEVAWAYVVEHRDRAVGRLVVRLALLPRLRLEPVLERVRQSGMATSSVLAPREGGGFWAISLQAAGHGPAGGRRRRVLLALGTCCALLAVIATALPFILQEQALRREEARIASLRPLVAEADTFRRQVAGRVGGSDAIAAEAARTGQVLNIIATLTTLLPDDTYLLSLAVRQRVITMAGRSASAARLIPLLTADPAMHNVAFDAPVTRVPDARVDAFSIRAEFGS